MAALPQRLLTHPKGGALAVIAHVDRAWGYSIQAPKMAGAQITPFRSSLGSIMIGDPVGHAVKDQFGGQFRSAFRCAPERARSRAGPEDATTAIL